MPVGLPGLHSGILMASKSITPDSRRSLRRRLELGSRALKQIYKSTVVRDPLDHLTHSARKTKYFDAPDVASPQAIEAGPSVDYPLGIPVSFP
jgi:hypothetical protein